MRILAVIPARGGSKRLPGKNIRLLGGKPLIAWTIDIVRGLAGICDLLVSTDDAGIASVAAGAGAMVPWLRPPELATDAAGSVEVCLHALDWYEAQRGPVDGLLLLQPTSPFRTRAMVAEGIALFERGQQRPVVSVSPAASHPLWCYRLEGDTMAPYIAGQGAATRAQDLPAAYALNGALYLIRPDQLRNGRSFCPSDAIPLIIESPMEALDIDTEWDWLCAEAVVLNR